MKPVKIKLIKRTWTGQECEKYELSSPSKKRRKQKAEKENVSENIKKNKSREKKIKTKSAVLTESPVLSPGSKTDDDNLSSSSFFSEDSESDSEELDEIFQQLRRSGIRTIKSYTPNTKNPNNSSKTPQSQTKRKSSKKNELEIEICYSDTKKKSKKNLQSEFENVSESKETTKRSSRTKKVAESERNDKVLGERNDATTDSKVSKTSKRKSSDYKTPEKTPNKSDILISSRSSSRRHSSRYNSDMNIDLEQIPEESEMNAKTCQTKNLETMHTDTDTGVDHSNATNECKRSTRKSLKTSKEIYVPELEKLPEDLVLNYKRTPKRVSRFEHEITPQKIKSATPRRSSARSRRESFADELFIEEETTPKRRSSRKTPVKLSSTQKRESFLLQTPTSKIEKKLPTTPLEKARLSLHVSAVPDGLPCREKEFNNILTFVKNKLLDGIGGCMYISGVPGTGKTATVTQVINQLRSSAKNGEVPDFSYIELNGMRLSDPRQAYVQLWQKLFDKEERIPSERAHKLLDNWFSQAEKNKPKKTTVLLVDELDLICTKKQDVVYNLLDWPTRTHSRLVVLSIANTMDMPERLFKGRITSRMGLTRLTFMPYTFKQLEEIVSERLKGLDAFLPDAVQLVTRKVAAVSGDARRALDICRRAAELPAPDETVKISHIEQAIKEMTNSNIVRIIRDCTLMEKYFLRALCDVTFRSNIDEIELLKVIEQFGSICVLEGIPRPTVTSVLTICHRLKCSRLIFSNQSCPGVLQRVMLNVTQDDVHYALQT